MARSITNSITYKNEKQQYTMLKKIIIKLKIPLRPIMEGFNSKFFKVSQHDRANQTHNDL